VLLTFLENLWNEGDVASLASSPQKSYSDRMATIGWTDAARRAGARLAVIATSTAIAAPAT
jgi:hypothetical protein